MRLDLKVAWHSRRPQLCSCGTAAPGCVCCGTDAPGCVRAQFDAFAAIAANTAEGGCATSCHHSTAGAREMIARLPDDEQDAPMNSLTINVSPETADDDRAAVLSLLQAHN